MSICIRPASPSDAEKLLEIYTYYVEHTAITFDYEVPSVMDFQKKIIETQKRYPYLVLLEDTKIVGYAYAGPFVGRKAYDWSAEMTVYLAPKARRCGFGRMLYGALEDALKQMGVLNLYACIGYPEVEDEYLTKNSVEFHEHLGYKIVGAFHNCGYKFGRWYHMVWMEKIIGEHSENMAEVRNFSGI